MPVSKRQQAEWDALAKTDPHAATVASLGGHLVRPALPDKGQWAKILAKAKSYEPGCGAPTCYLSSGDVPCGARLGDEIVLCHYCQDQQSAQTESKHMPKSAKQLIQEAPIDAGEYGDFIDRSHKRRIAARQSDHLPAERLASTAYQAAMRKLQRYTGITPRNQGDIQRAGMMMMQALQQVSQIEAGHEEELQDAAKELVLSLPEFKAAQQAVASGDLRLIVQLTSDIDLEGAQVDAENNTERDDLKIAQVAAELDLEVEKRKFLNMMTQGNAMAKLQSYHLMNDRLNAINPRLANLYGVLTSVGEFSYWIFPEDMQRGGMGQGMGAGGSVRLRAGEDGVTEIVAQGVTFPMLVHELVKGLMEYLSHDDELDDDTRRYVGGQADTLNNELTDIQIGSAAWQHIVALVQDQELLPYVYSALVKLPAGQFKQTMQAIMSGGNAGKQVVDNIVRQVRKELDNQGESEVGGLVNKLLE